MGQTPRCCPFTACKYEGLKVKKYIMMLGLMMVATSAMADNCAVWATGADGKAYCQSSGSSSNNNSANWGQFDPHTNTWPGNNNNNNNNNNQSCGGFSQQQCGLAR